MRGRLIFPFRLQIEQLDTAHSTYDPDFKEPALLPPVGGQGAGTPERAERTLLTVPAQIEHGEWEKLKMFFNGNSPDSRIVTVSHYRYLEDNGLVDNSGDPTLYTGDRLSAITDMDGNVQTTVNAKNQLYIVQVEPIGYGLGRKRNLLAIYWETRSSGVPT